MSTIQPQQQQQPQQQVQLQQQPLQQTQFGLTPYIEQQQQLKEAPFNSSSFNPNCHEVISSHSQSSSSIPSPPCSIPDQQQQQLIYNQHQQMIGMPSPNITNGLFDVKMFSVIFYSTNIYINFILKIIYNRF